MNVGLVGAGRRGTAHAAAVAALAPPVRLAGVADAEPARARAVAEAWSSRAFASTPDLLRASDAVVVAVPTAERYFVARAALAEGAHVFLEWPPAAGLAEAERLAAEAEEAGVEVGVARPLPVAALLAARPAGWAPRLVTLDLAADARDPLAARPWPHRLAGAVDLCAALARGHDVRHVEAEAERGPGAALRAVAFTLRFRGGTLAQAVVREAAPFDGSGLRLFAAGRGLRAEARGWPGVLCLDSDPPRDGGAPQNSPSPPAFRGLPPNHATLGLNPPDSDGRELADFLAAVAAGRPAPVPLHDALQTMRLVERVMQRLR